MEDQPALVEKEALKGRQKPGRKKGDNRKRIRITAIESDTGGYEVQISKCSLVELKTAMEAIDAEIERRECE